MTRDGDIDREGAKFGVRRTWVCFHTLPAGWKCIVVLLSVSVVFLLLAWATNLVPYAPVWGTVADWVTAIATVGALSTIFVQVAQWRADQRAAADLQRVRDRELAEGRRREREAFAISLGANFNLGFNSDVGGDMIRWTIRNGSPYPMLNVRVVFSPDVLVRDLGTLLPTSDDSGEALLPDAAKTGASASDFFVEYNDVWGGCRRYPRDPAPAP